MLRGGSWNPGSMPVLTERRIAELVAPYLQAGAGSAWGELTRCSPEALYRGLSRYLDLLVRWNARTNLTAIRGPELMVERHFGESLFAGLLLGRHLREGDSVLDFGSGGGLPGLPVQLLYPGLRVTLAESQGKKAAFLREVVRSLGLSTEVWGERVEGMEAERRFAAVTMRAVDRMQEMVPVAKGRVRAGGWLLQMVAEAVGGDGIEVHGMPGLYGGYVQLEQVS